MEQVNQFEKLLKDFAPPEQLRSLMQVMISLVPISDSPFGVLKDKDKFIEFSLYVDLFDHNTKHFIIDRDPKLDLRKIVTDELILKYWNRQRFLVILSVIAGTPDVIPTKFVWPVWFRPIVEKLKNFMDEHKIVDDPNNDVRKIKPEIKDLNSLAKAHTLWFEMKKIVDPPINIIADRCIKLLNEHPYDPNDFLTSLTHTLDFQISASILDLPAGDKDLFKLIKFYKINDQKSPSFTIKATFPNQGKSNQFPNSFLNQNLIYNTTLKHKQKISHFKSSFWSQIHQDEVNKVIEYLQEFVEYAQDNAKIEETFDFKSKNNDLIVYVLEEQLILHLTIQNEIDVKPVRVDITNHLVFPQNWQQQHPFYFSVTEKIFVPQKMYLPEVDPLSLPSYFVRSEFLQEMITFNKLNKVLDNRLPKNKNPIIYTNENFWDQENLTVYHIFNFKPRPPAQIGITLTTNGSQISFTPEEINSAYEFEEKVRNHQFNGVPSFKNSILNQWATELVKNKVNGTHKLSTLIDVIFYNFKIKADKGLISISPSLSFKSTFEQLGVSPFIVELFNFSQPQPIASLPTSPIFSTASSFFSSRKGRTKRTPRKRRSRPRVRRPRRQRSRAPRRSRNSRN